MTEAEFDFALTQVLQNFGWTKVGSETVKTGVHKLRATITEQAARINQLESERSDALMLAKQCTDRGVEVERQLAALKSNYKAVSQATHEAFSERIKALEDALREVKHCMSNVSVDSRWFDRGIATINELIGEGDGNRRISNVRVHSRDSYGTPIE